MVGTIRKFADCNETHPSCSSSEGKKWHESEGKEWHESKDDVMTSLTQQSVVTSAQAMQNNETKQV